MLLISISTYGCINTIKHYEGSCTDLHDSLDAGYELINENDLPKVYEDLFIQSLFFFPIKILKDREIKRLHLYSHIQHDNKNLEVLNELENNGCEIIVYWDAENFNDWYKTETRKKTINDIIGS